MLGIEAVTIEISVTELEMLVAGMSHYRDYLSQCTIKDHPPEFRLQRQLIELEERMKRRRK
jgi:hypothetical protein